MVEWYAYWYWYWYYWSIKTRNYRRWVDLGGDSQLCVALLRRTASTPRHSRPATIRRPDGRRLALDSSCRSRSGCRQIIGGHRHRHRVALRSRRRRGRLRWIGIFAGGVAVDLGGRHDRLSLKRSQTLLLLLRKRRLVVVERRSVAGGVLRQTTARVAQVGRHHPHRRGPAATQTWVHVGADRLGARAARRSVAVGRRRLVTPVRAAAADVRPNRAAPERASATAAERRRHGAVVDADVWQKSAGAASARRRRAAEPRPQAAGAAGHAGRALVGGVLAALDRLAARPRDVGRLGALLAGDDVELDLLAVADAAQVLARVVARDRRLVDEHVLLGVVTLDEAVAVLDVEPLHRAHDIRQDDLYTAPNDDLMADRAALNSICFKFTNLYKFKKKSPKIHDFRKF